MNWTPYIDPLMHHIETGDNLFTPLEKEGSKAFLLTLSYTAFVNKPKFGNPDKFPDEIY